MKILFIQRMPFLNVGTMILSAVLERAGHEVEILVAEAARRTDAARAIESADLLGFYCVSGAEEWVAGYLSDFPGHPPLVLGGPHPTFVPEALHSSPAEFAIRGEAEGALAELADALGNGKTLSDINNLCYVESGELRVNSQRDLVQDLDTLPFQNPSPYMKYPFLRGYIREFYPVITSRGCPHNCTYCFNKKFKELHRDKGKFTRRRSPENVIEEIRRAIKDYGVRKLVFEDDSFIVSRAWLAEFAELYNREIGLPFICQTPAASLVPETVELLAGMNCVSVRIGVETAHEENRRAILGKKVTNSQIAAAASMLKEHGVMIQTFNMAGIPGENFDDVVNTMMFNREIGVDFTWVSFYHHYPGTELYEQAMAGEKEGPHGGGDSFFRPAESTDRRTANMGMLMQFFNAVRMPESMARLLVSLPGGPAYKALHKIFYALSIRKINRLGWASFIGISLRARKYF